MGAAPLLNVESGNADMDIRIITPRYSDSIQGFPEEALTKAISAREVMDVREHFFVHGNVPHIAAGSTSSNPYANIRYDFSSFL